MTKPTEDELELLSVRIDFQDGGSVSAAGPDIDYAVNVARERAKEYERSKELERRTGVAP